MKLFASLLGHNLINVESLIKETNFVDGYHLDMIDLHFAPNLGLGTDLVNSILDYINKPIYLHLMLNKPELILPLLKVKKNSIVAWHFEKRKDIEIINLIKKTGSEPALAVMAETEFDDYKNLLDIVPRILVLSVKPGFSGGKFIEKSYEVIEKIAEYRDSKKLDLKIDLDGGVNKEVIEKTSNFGIDSITSSNFSLLKSLS